MVQKYFSTPKPRQRLRFQKSYPPLSTEERLQNWLKRVYANSAFMRDNKYATMLLLPEKLADDLELENCHVKISSNGELYHLSSETVLAVSRP